MVCSSQESASQRVRWLVCGLPSPLRQERLLLMLQGYFDDSGSDGTRPPFVLAGFILPAERWEKFSDEWMIECHREPRIEYFKMREAHGGYDEFSFSSEFRQMKVRALAALIEKHALHGLDTWFKWDEFNDFNSGLIGPAKDQPYSPLFFGIIDNVVEYQRSLGVFPSKIQLVFDEQGSAGRFAIQSYGDMLDFCEQRKVELDHRRALSMELRACWMTRTTPALQAADMLAWCLRFQLDNKEWAKSEWGWLCMDLNKTIWPGCQRFGKPYWDFIAESLKPLGPVTPPQA